MAHAKRIVLTLLLAGACTLALLPYAIPRVGTPQIRAAETAASETG